MIETKERPIIFNTEMVRAILDGRKTQTRRALKHKQHKKFLFWDKLVDIQDLPETTIHNWKQWLSCPYGQPGDRLWVRETFYSVGEVPERPEHLDRGHYKKSPGGWSAIYYRADGTMMDGSWSPSIHMPRWASRIDLEVVSVKVEQLQDLNEKDAQSEGVRKGRVLGLGRVGEKTYREGFIEKWDDIYHNRGYPWLINPWVWVIEFKLLEDRSA